MPEIGDKILVTGPSISGINPEIMKILTTRPQSFRVTLNDGNSIMIEADELFDKEGDSVLGFVTTNKFIATIPRPSIRCVHDGKDFCVYGFDFA